MTVTRPVIVDLWPLYESGEASLETRALVDEFLRGDPDFARELRCDAAIGAAVAPLPPDVETRTLALTRRRLRGIPWLLFFAMMFSMMAFGRIVSDTSWDVSPKNFIATAALAAACWAAYVFTLWRMRARILIVGRRRG